MKSIIHWFRQKFVLVLTGIVAVFGTFTARLVTCTGQTGVAVVQVASNPANQLAAVETASFVANLFYGGADDPFATPGIGGETGKLTHVVLRKGEKLFGEAMTKIIGKTDEIIETSRTWASPQIQEGQRALQKKVGHAISLNNKSAFEGIKYTQENAELVMKNIFNKANEIVIRPKRTMIYSPNGQGVSINTKTGRFIGFVERSLEKEL
jgi:hypothetical protein